MWEIDGNQIIFNADVNKIALAINVPNKNHLCFITIHIPLLALPQILVPRAVLHPYVAGRL